jgi:hypothetical protein
VRGTHAAAVLERGVTETVIGRAFVGVFEYLVGLVGLLEAMLGAVIPGITVGMTLHRLLAKGRLDVAVTCRALDRKDFIEAAFGHSRSNPALHAKHHGRSCPATRLPSRKRWIPGEKAPGATTSTSLLLGIAGM